MFVCALGSAGKGVAPFGDHIGVDFVSRSTPREGAPLFGSAKPAKRPDRGAAHRRRIRIERRRRGVDQIALPRVADCDHDVAPEPLEADSFDRAPRESLSESGIVERGKFGERRRLEIGARDELGLMRARRELVPGADGEAISQP